MLLSTFNRMLLNYGRGYCFSSENFSSYSPIKIQLIKNSLYEVHKYGWSQNAIHAGCIKMELSPASHRLVQPYDLIAYSMRNWNMMALKQIDESNFEGKVRVRDRIHCAIKTRLMKEIQYIDTWNQAMGIGAHPSHISQTKNLLWEFSDEVWRRCGDVSTDYNYYSKRVLFNMAYATTELHLLTDQSVDKIESWNFLERRLENILSVGRGISDLKTVGGAALDGILNLVTMFIVPPMSEIKNPIKDHKLSDYQKAEERSQKDKL